MANTKAMLMKRALAAEIERDAALERYAALVAAIRAIGLPPRDTEGSCPECHELVWYGQPHAEECPGVLRLMALLEDTTND